MRKLYTLCLLLAIMCGLSACDKCHNEVEQNWTTETVDAIIKWTGSPAVDGCEYTLFVGQVPYKPTNQDEIPETFKEAGHVGMPVEVTMLNYHKKITTVCGLASFEINAVKVLDIRKK